MPGQTWLLLRLQGRGALNTFRHTFGPADKAGGVIFAAVLALAVILAGSIAGSFAAGAAARFPEAGVPRLFPAAVLGLGALLLVLLALRGAAGALFFDRDLSLLLSAPVDPRAVFLSKVLAGLARGAILPVLGMAAPLVAFGNNLGLGPLYTGLALLAALATPVLTTWAAALVVLLAARWGPVRGLRMVLGGAVLLLLGGCARLGRLAAGAGEGGTDLPAMGRALLDSPVPPFIAARGLAAAPDAPGLALAALALYITLAVGGLIVCTELAGALYLPAWARLQSGGSATPRGAVGPVPAPRAWGARTPRTPLALVIAGREWRGLVRDRRTLTTLAPHLALWALYGGGLVCAASALRPGSSAVPGGGAPPQLGAQINAFLAAVVLVMAALLFLELSLSSLSRQGRAWSILRLAPIAGATILRGWFLALALPFVLLSSALLGVVGLWRGFSLGGFLYGWGSIELIGLSMLAVTLSMGVVLARPHPADPLQLLDGGARLLGELLALALGGLTGGILCLPLVVAAQTEAPAPLWLWLAAWVGAALVAGGGSALTLLLAHRRLPRAGEV
jgi:hypothetical protein